MLIKVKLSFCFLGETNVYFFKFIFKMLFKILLFVVFLFVVWLYIFCWAVYLILRRHFFENILNYAQKQCYFGNIFSSNWVSAFQTLNNIYWICDRRPIYCLHIIDVYISLIYFRQNGGIVIVVLNKTNTSYNKWVLVVFL